MAKNKQDVPDGTAHDKVPQRTSCKSGLAFREPGGEHEKLLQKIRVCLEQLAEPERDLMRLKFTEGLSYQELSRRTGLSVNTVGSIVHKALQRVAAELEHAGFRL